MEEVGDSTTRLACFNRTFMELKLSLSTQFCVKPAMVLIVPLWNWNCSSLVSCLPLPCFNRTFMELKLRHERPPRFSPSVLIVPLWNWNHRSLRLNNKKPESFNRTFMELKYTRIGIAAIPTRVLIVPLWNWNAVSCSLLSFNYSFNRTFMELKLKVC